jgi:hypothetical protein
LSQLEELREVIRDAGITAWYVSDKQVKTLYEAGFTTETALEAASSASLDSVVGLKPGAKVLILRHFSGRSQAPLLSARHIYTQVYQH